MISGLPWGLALSSGVNTYLPLFLLALFARYGHIIHLSPPFAWLMSDQAIVILGGLAVCEILAQKFPVLDNVWDFLHTLLRPIAGAVAGGATVNAANPSEIVAAMLIGGALAAAAHSTKSGLRLVSTSKSLGTANFALSLGEDAGVVTTTLLSVYAPWVMLVIVALFVAVFILVGPRIFRTLLFDLHIAGSAVAGVFRWVFGGHATVNLNESLLHVAPERLREFQSLLHDDEELLCALPGWKRSRGGPRKTWLALTSRRVYSLDPRLFGSPRVQALDYSEISVPRYRNLRLFSRAELLTHRHEKLALTFSNRQMPLAELAMQSISHRVGSEQRVPPQSMPAVPPIAVLEP